MGHRVSVTLEPCISRDASGIEAVVSVKGLPRRRKRFALAEWETDDGRGRVRAWVTANKTALEEERRAFGTPVSMQRGSLEADVAEWESRLNVREGAGADRSHMRAWLPVVLPGDTRPLGQWPRAAIQTKHVDQVIQLWQTAPSPTAIRKVHVKTYTRKKGKAPSEYVRAMPATSGAIVATRTIRHRCRVFADMWRTIDGTDDGATPIDKAKVPRIPKGTLPPRIPQDLLHAVLIKLRTIDLLTFVRYAVATTTMQRPCQVGRAEPDDVNLEAGVWIVRNAKGAPAHTINLGVDAVEAWRAFIAAAAWGKFDTTKYGNHIHAAGLPASLRPYAARHTGAAAAIVAGVPWSKLQDQLGHGSIDTTKNFYTGFMLDAQREVAKAIGDRFTGVFGPRLVAKP